MSTTAIVFDIQRNSMEDGPGIRTTVFLKGCPMRCQWCHNPESFARQPQTVTLPNGTIRTYGKPMTAAEVFQIVLADRPFFETSGGGVTLSGGEPLLYPEFVGKLFADCQNAGIHTAVETNGVPVWNHYETILPHTDLLLFDYKATPSKLHAELTGVPSEPVLECLDRLVKAGKNIILRCPIVPTVNNNPEHLAMIARLSQHYNITVHLMPYHNTARDKWQALRLPYLLAGLPSMTDAEVDHTISQIVAYGAHAELIGLA